MRWLLVALALLIVSPALGRDHGQFGNVDPEMKAWFNGLASQKGLCCSVADGEMVADVDWETKDGHYRVRLDGQWTDVPDDAVITVPNKFGRAMVWPIRLPDSPVTIRCFLPGPLA